MRKLSLLLLLSLIYTLTAGLSIGNAQDEPSLRELASLNNIEIGVAVYSQYLANSRHSEIVAEQFNVLTHEAEAKACELNQFRSRFDFKGMDRIVSFAEANDIEIHGHTLVWHQCMADWILAGSFTREEAIGYLREYIYTVVGRYRGRIRVWDVVNEAFDDDASLRVTPWQQLIGDDYIELAFQFAHEADPDALLFYNDYDIEGINAKSNAAYDMIQDFIDRGIPIDGIGLQGHFLLGGINRGAITANIERLGELGLEVQFTEVDIWFSGEPDDDKLTQLAADYHTILDICLESDACTTMIVWGLSDSNTWLRDRKSEGYENPDVAPLLYDDDYQPKLAYFALLDLLARKAGETPILSDEELAAIVTPPMDNFVIPEPSFSETDQLSPDSVEGRIYYAPYPVTITLDGETDDWVNVPRVTVDSGLLMPADNDTSMTVAVAVDDEKIYFLADVTDSKVVYGNYGIDEWYREDSVEFYLNTTGDLEAYTYSAGIVQFGIPAANIADPEEPLFGGNNSADAQVEFIVVETDKGYRIEASVPLVTDVWSIDPQHETVLGFQAHLNGSQATDRDTKLIWSVFDNYDQSWQNPALFGQLIIWDSKQ